MEVKVDFSEIEKIIKNLEKEFQTVKGVRVGYIKNTAYPNGLLVKDNAIIQNNGTSIGIPAHSLTVYKQRNKKDTKFNRNGRFVKKESSNWSKTLTTKAYTINISARPFLDETMKQQEEWLKVLIQSLSKEQSLVKGMQQVGLSIQNSIIASIDDMNDPPNAKSTIRNKKSSKPLVGRFGKLVNDTKIEMMK